MFTETDGIDHSLDIPDFLKRQPGASVDGGTSLTGGAQHIRGPSPHAAPTMGTDGKETSLPDKGRLPGVSPVPFSPFEPSWRKNFPQNPRDLEVIAELQSDKQITAKEKSYDRIGAMKVKKSDKAALAAGKTWDSRIAKWV